MRSENASFYSPPFGLEGDIPVAADYDGDGKSDLAVFRPGENVWYLQQSHAGFAAVGFGSVQDTPAPSAFLR